MSDRPVTRPLPAQDNTTQRDKGVTRVPRVGYEPAPQTARPLGRLSVDVDVVTNSCRKLQPEFRCKVFWERGIGNVRVVERPQIMRFRGHALTLSCRLCFAGVCARRS
jgi:hypothetical protein